MHSLNINGRIVGPGQPTYIIAEMSANHSQDFTQAVEIIRAAKEAGADAVKLQTYTPDTLTIDCDNNYFKIEGTLWEGSNLYQLYGTAYTPWEWHSKLFQVAQDLEIDLFSTPFDHTAVDLLEEIGVPVVKVASFELVDLPLLRRIGKTGKPVILSTGMATLAEIDEAVATLRAAGCQELALLKCSSAYPSPPEVMNLRTIPHLSEVFSVPVGLSDHTLGTTVPVAAVALGACIIEKHFTISRELPSADRDFSLEPAEFRAMVEDVRMTESSLGQVHYGLNPKEEESKVFRRSLFVVQDIAAGAKFTHENVRSIRPGYGLHTRHLDAVIGRQARAYIERGTPLSWEHLG